MENLKVSDGLSVDGLNGMFYSTGDIIMLNSNTAPDGFLACDGQYLYESVTPALYAFLGTYYDPAGTFPRLPNLNSQTYWIFPTGTVGNESAYPVASSNHSHNQFNTTIGSVNYETPAHNHSFAINSANSNENHAHNGPTPGVGINVSSTLANRSNGSGQGVNLAIYGHTHSWGSAGGLDAANHTHSHTVSFNASSGVSNHSHNSTMTTTTNTSNEYIPQNVISMRYYIKW